MNAVQTTFQVNQKIVYPSQGVGIITEITEKIFKEETLLYYVIYLEVSDMTVMVPVGRCDDLGIRAIVGAEEARTALQVITEDFEPITSDWKLRYQLNMDLLKKGTVGDIAMIVRSLYHRSKVKELPILERKLYDSAKKLLEDEISFALDLSIKEVQALIHEKLEPPNQNTDDKKKGSISSNFDDDDDDFLDAQKDDSLTDDIDDDDLDDED